MNATAALDELHKILRGWAHTPPMIKPTLHRRSDGKKHWYRVQVVEEQESGVVWYNQKLNNCVEWSAKKLKDWPDVQRMSFDMWDFKSKKDAEKFITFFHLSWQQ